MIDVIDKPVVSVCLITYNHAKFVKEAIESILLQEASFPWDLIIADDCSTDGTTDIVKDFAARFPNKIHLILQIVNVGMHKNFVELFTTPTSKYIAFLDGDDIWTDKERLNKQVNFLESHPQYGMLYGKYGLMNEKGNPIPLNRYPQYKSGHIFKDVITHRYLPPMAASLMVNELVQQVYKNKSALGNDFYLIASLCKISEVAFINESYFTYRINNGSITNSQGPAMSALCLENMSLFKDEFPIEVEEGIKNWRLKQLYFKTEKQTDLNNFILLLKNFRLSGIHIRQIAKCFLGMCKLKIT